MNRVVSTFEGLFCRSGGPAVGALPGAITTRRGRAFVSYSCAIALLATCWGCGAFVPPVPLQGPAPADIQLPSGGVDVPAQISGNLTYVTVLINGGGPYTFILDTGASSVVVSPQIADLFPQSALGTMLVNSAVAGVESRVIRINTLELGTSRFTTFDAAVVDVNQIIQNDLGVTISGIVGFPLFETLLLTVDYPGERVLVQTGTLPAEDDCHVFAMQKNEVGLLTMAITVAGQTHQAVIDTGFDGFLSLPSDTTDLPFLESPTLESVSLITGPATVLSGRLADGSLTFGCFRSTTTPVNVGGDMALFGASAFQNLVLTMDQQSGRVRLR